MRARTVLSLEQALSLPSATLRFVQLGWRVIRIESTPSGDGLPGDPNRYIGRIAVDDDRRTYFVAPNVGKEAIALNLKDARGREALADRHALLVRGALGHAARDCPQAHLADGCVRNEREHVWSRAGDGAPRR